jgi:hypothetical protein
MSSYGKADARVIFKGSNMGCDGFQAPGCHGAFRICCDT